MIIGATDNLFFITDTLTLLKVILARASEPRPQACSASLRKQGLMSSIARPQAEADQRR